MNFYKFSGCLFLFVQGILKTEFEDFGREKPECNACQAHSEQNAIQMHRVFGKEKDADVTEL